MKAILMAISLLFGLLSLPNATYAANGVTLTQQCLKLQEGMNKAIFAGSGITPCTAPAQQTAYSDWFAGIIKCHSVNEKLDVSVFAPVGSMDTNNGKLILESSIGPRISPLLLDAVKVDFGITITADAVAWDGTTGRKIKLEARGGEMNDQGEIPGTLDLGGLDLGIVSPGTRTIPLVCDLLGGHS